MGKLLSALAALREEIKTGILDEKIPMEYKAAVDRHYYAEVTFAIGGIEDIKMTIADSFICYHNPFIQGIFDKEEDFAALTQLVKRHISLSSEDKKRIEELQLEIEKIKKGKVL